MKLSCNIALFLYYFFARHLPQSDAPYSFFAKSIRAYLCKFIFKSTGNGINVEHGAYFANGRDIEIGNNSGLGIHCRVLGPICIGNDVMMGPDVIIITQNHNCTRTDIPMNIQGSLTAKRVVVGDDVWIGARVIILPGVCIGNGSIIGSSAVVTKDVPPYSIIGGNPARILKSRN